jgi:hypothetical protein
MAAVDNTAASNYLKNRFSPKRIQNLSYEGSPLFAMLPKKTDFGGDNLKVPVSYADLKGRSANFGVAQANKQGSDTERFLITTVKDYALFSIQGQTIKQSRGDLNAWLPALEKEAESAARALARSASWAVYRSSVGDIATMASNSSTNITLGNRADIQNFEVGMTIQMVDPAATTSARSGKMKITAVYRDAGVIAVNTAITSAVPAAAANDLIVPEGDLNLRLTGLAGWIAVNASSASTNLFSCNQQTDDVRLGGIKFDASGMNILEAIVDAAARAGENGASPDKLFINFDKWRELSNYLGSQKIYTQGTAWAGSGQPKADVGFEGVKIHGPSSIIECYADRHCQPNLGWLLQLDTWTLHSTGGVPMLLEEDGQSILREATDDAYEGRWGAYYQMYTNAPGLNVRINNL